MATPSQNSNAITNFGLKYLAFCILGDEKDIAPFRCATDFLQILIIVIIYGFTSYSRIFHVLGDVTITGEGLQNLGLKLALRAFE
jgi:hypothetical protein